jgi:phage terminase small subunit
MGRFPELTSVNSNYEQKKPKPSSDGIVPKAPAWLGDNAKKIYKQTSKEIVMLGIAGKCDQNILAIFSEQMSRLQIISKLTPRDNSVERLQNDLTSSVLSLAKELGITPSARAKMRLAKPDETSEVEEFLNNQQAQ